MQKSTTMAGREKTRNLSLHEGVVVHALLPADVHALPLADVVLVELALHVDRLVGRNVDNVGLQGEGVVGVVAAIAAAVKRVVKAAVAVVDDAAGQLAVADVLLAEADGAAPVVAHNIAAVHGDWVPPHVHGLISLLRSRKVRLNQKQH